MDKSDYTILFIFAILFLFITGGMLFLKSYNYHDGEHIFMGYSYLVYGNSFNSAGHPILTNILVAIPLIFMDIDYPDLSELGNGPKDFGLFEFLYYGNNNPEFISFFAKIPLLFLAVLLGFFVYKWSFELYGRKAAIFSLLLYSFHPLVIAYSGLITMDITLATFFFISLYFFWRYYKKPCWKNLLLLSFTFGLAMLGKPTAILLLPIILIIVVFVYFKSEKKFTFPIAFRINNRFITNLLNIAILFGLMSVFGFLVFNLAYINEIHPLYNVDDPMYENTDIRSLERLDIIVQEVLPESLSSYEDEFKFFLVEVPIPAPHFYEGLYTLNIYLSGMDDFYHGTYTLGKKWDYYLVSFFVKNPLSFLIILLMAFIFLSHGKPKDSYSHYFLLIPSLFVFLFLLNSTMYGGARYFLPFLPLIFVLCGNVLNYTFKNKLQFAFRFLMVVLLVFYIFSSLIQFPDYICSYNGFVGNENGHTFFIAADCDMYQDIKPLAKYLVENNISEVKINLAGFNPTLPERGFNYTILSGDQPESGIIVVNANALEGLKPRMREDFAWLRDNFTPDKSFGHSIFLYNITLQDLEDKGLVYF